MSQTTTNIIVKDTDTTINIVIKDKETKQPVDISTLAGLVIEVFQKNIPFDQFSLNTQAGFRAITVVDGPNGKVRIFLNAANTADGVIGRKVFYEAKTQIVNANFDDGTEEKSGGIIELATLVETETDEATFQ